MNDKRLPIPVMLAAFALFAGLVVLFGVNQLYWWLKGEHKDGRRLS